MFKAFTNTNYPYVTESIRNLGTDTALSVVSSSLVVYLDAGNRTSYPGSGSTWYDLSGNGKNATIYTLDTSTGAPTSPYIRWITTDNGLFEIANTGFFSNTSFAEIVGSLGVSFTTGFTVQMWFQYARLLTAGNTYAYGFFSGNSLFGPGPLLQIAHGGGESTNVWVYGIDSSNYYSQGASPSGANGTVVNRWGCYCITYDSGSNSSTTYFNGVNTGQSRSTTGTPNRFLGTMSSVRPGFGPGGNERGSEGRFGACLIYSRALTAQEVNQNFWAQAGRYNSCCNGIPNM